MKRALFLFLLLAPQAAAVDLLDRLELREQRIGKRDDGRPIYAVVASLTPMRYFAAPMPYFQLGAFPGGGGGSLSPSSVITGITDCAVLYNNALVLGGDATNFCWTDTTNANVLTLGAGTGPGALKLLEGSGGGTSGVTLTVAAALSGDFTATLPSATTTLAGLAVAQTFSALQTFTSATFHSGASAVEYFGVNPGPGFFYNINLTPDSMQYLTGTTGESVHLIQQGDITFDFNNGPCGTSACTTPTLIGHSQNQDTQEYWALTHDGGSGVLQAGNSTAKSFESRFGRTVTLTEAGAAEVVITIVNATTETFGIDFYYLVTATDGTNRATRKGYLNLVCDNAAGTMTCTKDATAETDDASILIATGGATLTYAIASDVATANTAKLTFDINSSLAVNAASITWRADLLGKGTIQ